MSRSAPLAVLFVALFANWGRGGEPAVATDFQRDIQPILARCWSCHGAADAEGGLRLTDRDQATAGAESGSAAIVPGDPDHSELLRRVLATEEELRMPPEGPALTPAEIEQLRRWIAEGAPWPAHWAYRRLSQPPIPDAGDDWAQNPIDRFVIAKLSERGLAPSPPADRATLMRRLYFDLLGLPPTAEQIEAFVNDPSPLAYERLVDELLANPSHGERYARHWMDLAHFAETHGHDQDRPRDHAWPYRDYLIAAFNDDKPYGQFVREQVAGDALFPESPQAVVATGFLAAGPWDESSLRDIREDTLDREVARYLDRDDIVTTVMSTFVSSTVHCARCHDHKFDPISQAEYYGLQAVFAAIDKGNRSYDADPRVGRRRDELAAALAELPGRLAGQDPSLEDPDLATRVADWEAELAATDSRWQTLRPEELGSTGGSTLTSSDDGSVLSGGARPERDLYTVVAPISAGEIRGLRLEVLTDDSLPQRGPGRQDNGNLHLNELRLFVIADDGGEQRELKFARAVADFDQSGWSVDRAIDGQDATAWGIHPEVGKPHEAVFELAEPLVVADTARLRIELHQTHGGGHLIGRFRLSTTSRTPRLTDRSLEPELARILGVATEARTPQERRHLAAAYLTRSYQAELAGLPPQSIVYCGSNRFVADGSFRPTPQPRVVRLLHRGDITQPRDEVQPLTLSCLEDLPAALAVADPTDEGARRAALANWLADHRNPLTWRSIANRVWQYHFGRGLVDTPSDFGRMGTAPTHPELLDWLAARLRDRGESLKDLHRLIVTSATYRQSSSSQASSSQASDGQASAAQSSAAVIDGDNLYLWRMNRRRLDAESYRDAVFAIAGTLDFQMGGPSVKQFVQTPGMHVTPNVDYRSADVDSPAMRRRSVYRFLFRTIPDPFMDALDCPDASQWTPTRGESVTPMQALATLNDKAIVHQCEQLAARIERDRPTDPDGRQRARAAVRQILGREASEVEVTGVAVYLLSHGLANACRVLFNSNEFMFVD